MIHGNKGRKLNRNTAHRKALLRNLSIAFLEHEFIKTTLPKAKEFRPFVERIITLSKVDTLNNRRRVASLLANQAIVDRLFKSVGPRVASRNGGYIRILKCGFRTGDKAPMAIVELVDRVVVEAVAE
ncbi:MAG: 50S ribosomal protein L17 [Rickettsiales bacterium]|nr:50S ribosomal protein L17 [Rickettsiales bacterium]